MHRRGGRRAVQALATAVPERPRAAAEGELRKIKREGAKLRIDVPGNPDLAAEGIIVLDDTWPTYVRGRWSIDKVTARGSRREGYRCAVEATWPEGREE